MPSFNLYCPIQVRYSDIDAQGHLNNARYASYLEQARCMYLQQLDLWDGVSFADIKLIVADLHIRYLAPVFFGQDVRVGIRCSRIGNKSLIFEYQIEDCNTQQVMASAETVMVYFDYHTQSSASVTQAWREKISSFENIKEG